MFETIKQGLSDQEISLQDGVQLATIAKTEADVKKGIAEDRVVSEQMSIDEAKAFAIELDQTLQKLDLLEKNMKK